MKAKEYFAKHNLSEPFETKENSDIAMHNVKDMILETKEIAKVRGVKTNAGLTAILKETIDKYKAYNVLIEKHYGEQKLKDDGILLFIKHTMPDIYDDVCSLLR